MSEDIQLSMEKFSKQLSQNQVLVFQVMSLAMGAGILVFLLIVLHVYFFNLTDTEPQEPPDSSVLKILTVVHILEAGIAYIVGFILYRHVVSRRRLLKHAILPLSRGMNQRGSLEGNCAAAMFSGTVLRLAMYEGTALFGLVICLTGSLDGTLQHYPLYWLNLFSLVFMILFILITFPTRQKLEDIFRARFGDPNMYQGF